MPSKNKATNALVNHKAEEEQINHNNIVQALTRIRSGKTEKIKLKAFGKISVQRLAEEAGISRASLYGNHKELLDQLRKINATRSVGVNEKRKKQEDKIASDKEIIQELTRTRELLAQENYRLNDENKRLVQQVETLASQLSRETNVASINKNRK